MLDAAPVERHSLSGSVYQQIRAQIVGGRLAPGTRLPSERGLSERLGVNRGAVREGLKRLEQARLVEIRHGGAARVLDYRRSAGLDLLPDLLRDDETGFRLDVVRGIMEMRSAIAPDVARLAAHRAAPEHHGRLAEQVAEMESRHDDLGALQTLATDFWDVLVEASDNLAYRLAYNSLRATYDELRGPLRPILADELGAVASYAALAGAVRAGEASQAESRARALIERGRLSVERALRGVGGQG